jgi:hypothetical protein
LRHISLFLIIGVLFLSSITWCQTLTNEDIIISSVRAAAERENFGDLSKQIRIISDSKGINNLIADGLADAVRTHYAGVTLTAVPDSISHNLYFDILGFSFDYKKGGSRGFLRSRKIKRELITQLRINIESGPDRALLESRNLSVIFSDEIEPGQAKFVGSREISELSPAVPGSGWSRYTEPSLVIASVGILVYLFFANR